MLAKLRLISHFQKKCPQIRVEVTTKSTGHWATTIDIIITFLTWPSAVRYANAFIENFIVFKSLLWHYLSYFKLWEIFAQILIGFEDNMSLIYLYHVYAFH